MKKKSFRLYYLFSCLGVLIVSWYPLTMGVRVITDMLLHGTVLQENYPKYIIPYTPMSIAIILGVALMPLCFKLCKKYALAGGAAVATVVFFVIELLFEQKVIVSTVETVTTLESWQMYMCYSPPGGWGETVTTHKTKTAVEILMGEYNPAFKLHFCMIALVLIFAILNSLYGFGHMVRTGEKKRMKSLILQSVCAVTFLGLCILACFTAFWRDGNILVTPLSAVLMAVFFILLGVTAGIFAGSFLLGKRKLLSVGLPALLASVMTLLMYVGEMILLSGYLYLLGNGAMFRSLPGIILAPVDILIILASGGITACVFALLHGINRKTGRILMIVLCLLFAAVAFLPLLSPWKTTGIEPTHRQQLVLPSDCAVRLLETVSNEHESSYQIGADLSGTDFSAIGQTLSDKIAEEWKTYDSLTEEQRLASSRAWGVVGIQGETWSQCEEAAGLSIANPLENLEWLEHTSYFGTEGQAVSEPISHVQLLAQTDYDRTLSQIDMTAGYACDDIRVTLTATVCADAKTYTTGSVCNGYADYFSILTETGTGIPVLTVTTWETNNTCYYNDNYYDPTAYWVDGNVLYTLRVYGKQEERFQIDTLLQRILDGTSGKTMYTKADFQSVAVGRSTFSDVYEIAPTKSMQITGYGGVCEYPMEGGGYIRIEFYGEDLIVGAVEAVPGTGETFIYSDEQLTEIAESVETKDKMLEQYPTAYTRTVSMVQNDISNANPAVEVCYRGETKVLRLMFDDISGSKILSHFYNTFCSRNEFDTLVIGQSLSDVQTIDPEGEYVFLYTGRNDVPRVSTHYTTDGFVISIMYDTNNVIEKIDIVPM